MLEDPLAVVDLETTGTRPTRDRITEIGIVLLDGGQITETWSSLVNPGIGIPPAIQSLTGISNAMVAEAPPFEALAEAIAGRLAGRLFVAHNARFDLGFLKNALGALGHEFRPRSLCTLKLSRRLYPNERRHNLGVLIERHGLAAGDRHRALGDATATADFLRHLREHLDPGTLESAVRAVTGSPTLPDALPRERIDALPEGPGVYRFYGEGGTPLYVGKSVNLRARVLSHFSADHRVEKDRRIVAQIRDLDWIETPGELGALIREARLVKELLPVHNRRLRRHQGLASIAWDPAGEAPPRVVREAHPDPATLQTRFGLFRTAREAQKRLRRLVEENGLCHRLTGLEKGQGPCFAYQLERCRGACAGAETRARHDQRLHQALEPLRMEDWPFNGRVGIRERHPVTGEEEIHLLDRWCYLGSAGSAAELDALLEAPPQAEFDLDTYRILHGHLRRNARRLDILQNL